MMWHGSKSRRSRNCKSLTWGVNNKEARQLEVKLFALAQRLRAHADGITRNVCGADLLCDTTCLALLHARSPYIVQQLRFACRSISIITLHKYCTCLPATLQSKRKSLMERAPRYIPKLVAI